MSTGLVVESTARDVFSKSFSNKSSVDMEEKRLARAHAAAEKERLLNRVGASGNYRTLL